MKRVLQFLSLFILSFLLFLVFSAGLSPQNLLAGAGVALVVAVIGQAFFNMGMDWLNPVRWMWFLVYVPVFIWEMIRANISIALVVLKPSLPIAPGIFKYRTGLKTEWGKLLLTSSITLTPGTLSVDINNDTLDIHCVRLNDVQKSDIEKFEKYIKRICE